MQKTSSMTIHHFNRNCFEKQFIDILSSTHVLVQNTFVIGLDCRNNHISLAQHTSSNGKRSLSSSFNMFHFWIRGGISIWIYSCLQNDKHRASLPSGNTLVHFEFIKIKVHLEQLCSTFTNLFLRPSLYFIVPLNIFLPYLHFLIHMTLI